MATYFFHSNILVINLVGQKAWKLKDRFRIVKTELEAMYRKHGTVQEAVKLDIVCCNPF